MGREALRQFKTTNPTVRTLSTRAATKRWRPLRCCTGLGRAVRHGAARRGAAREEGLKSHPEKLEHGALEPWTLPTVSSLCLRY